MKRPSAAIDALVASADGVRADVAAVRKELAAIAERFERLRTRNRQLVKNWRRRAEHRASVATGPLTAAGVVTIEGKPHRRAAITTLSAGRPVEIAFADWMGITRTAEIAPDVRALWDRLLATEAATAGGVLRSAPATILDVGPAVISRDAGGATRVELRDRAPEGAMPLVSVPRFSCNRFPRKLRNFGHWLLDYIPQVVALSAVAPHPRFLLPDPLGRFHRSTLALIDVSEDDAVAWDGSPVGAERLLLLDHDGRLGGGRPLALLRELHAKMLSGTRPTGTRRRLYISRRDAKKSRRWSTNEAAVETLFASRGFEVIVLSECPLEQQIAAFRDAHVVAGVSGAGLSDMVFAPEGAHLIVLHTESLMRWYAVETRSRAHWLDADTVRAGELAALGDSPRFYAHMAASLSQHCHSFLGADEIPIGDLTPFLDAVLDRAGGA